VIIHAAKSLFAWDELEDSPSLKTIRELLAALPDGKLLKSLRTARGKGRDDYAITALWGVVVLRVALRHTSTAAVLGELGRNEGLRRLIGIESEQRVPKEWNMSRFEEVLGQEPHRSLLKDVFSVLIQRLGIAVAELGSHAAADATGLSARRKRVDDAQKNEIKEGLPQASGGRKEYTDDQGNVTKVVEWFGFKLHLLVDVKNEVVLSYEVTDTRAGDGETLPALLEQAEANLPPRRIKHLAYDKAADSDDVHKLLSSKGITPLIEMRALWRGEHERMLPGHDGSSNVVYDEDGTIYCAPQDGLHRSRAEAWHTEVPLPGQARGLELSDVKGLQRGKILWHDSASTARGGRTTVSRLAACDQEVRADVQRTHRRRAR